MLIKSKKKKEAQKERRECYQAKNIGESLGYI